MKSISILTQEMQEVLTTNILPYWMERMVDEQYGGFYGCITGKEELVPEAEKGAILNARILWTFSAAYRLLKRPEYLAIATRAKEYIVDLFYDRKFGGVYWSLTYKGEPLAQRELDLCRLRIILQIIRLVEHIDCRRQHRVKALIGVHRQQCLLCYRTHVIW